MAGYLVNFSVYTLAMIGIIFGALFVFKTLSGKCFSRNSSILSVEDSMSLSQRKTLYIVKAENERFLIAADIDKTSLIAKLEEPSTTSLKEITQVPLREDKSSQLKSLDGIRSLDEFSSIVDFKRELNREPVMKQLAKKLSVV